MISIKKGAIFISDTHLNSDRDVFIDFLKDIEEDKIVITQLFFMGDMFDFLCSEIEYSKELYQEVINSINRLSKTVEIFYFEGNHDFNLKEIFPQTRVYPLSSQPILAEFEDKKLLLSHGDVYGGVSYKLFHLIVRNTHILNIINYMDKLFNNQISKRFFLKQKNKLICKKIENFHKIIKQKIHLYDIDLSEVNFILEGHYHQGLEIEVENIIYINFKSFACDRTYYIVQGDKSILQSKVF